jgi:RimJ/RimL family protein N-acetyltransferase
VYGERTDDLRLLEAFLCSDRLYAAQTLCHLEQAERCRCAVARADGVVVAAAVLFRGEVFDALTLAGDPDAVLAAVAALGTLPRQFWLWAREEHLLPLADALRVGSVTRMLRMATNVRAFRPAPRLEGVRRLTPDDLALVERLYRHTPGVVLRPEHLSAAMYYGVFVDGQLVAAAGTHGHSRRHGLAIVGNVLTHPAWRGRGYATACTSVLTAELLRWFPDVVLNVAADNAPAKHIYARLGYTVHCRLVEVQVGQTMLF